MSVFDFEIHCKSQMISLISSFFFVLIYSETLELQVSAKKFEKLR